jgi:hypothetical protein
MLMGTSDIVMPTPPTPVSCAFYQEPAGEGGQQCATSAYAILSIPGRLLYKATGFNPHFDNDYFSIKAIGVNVALWLVVGMVASKLFRGGR